MTISVQQAAASQGISQDALERILHRVSEHHGEDLAQRLLARLGPGPPPPPAGAAERVSFGTSTGPMMQDAMVGGDGAVMRDRSVDARRPTMRDASVEGRPTMRDASIEARRPVMRDASMEARGRRPRSSSPEEMEVTGGDPPPPPPWIGSQLSRRTGTDTRISRNLLTSFSHPRPREVRAILLPSVYPFRCSRGGLHRHHRRRRALGCLRRTTLEPHLRQTSALPLHQCGMMSDLASSCPSSSAWTTHRRPRLVVVCDQSCAAGRFESPT